MTSKISIHIETDDMALAARVAGVFRSVGAAPELAAPYGQTEGAAVSSEEPRPTESPGKHLQTVGKAEWAPEVADTNAPRDQHGVAFSVHYCAQAEDPFYSSGKRSGQWKKKRGVSDNDYDDWYAEELAEVRHAGGTEEHLTRDEDSHAPTPVNTAGAFGGQATQQAPATPAPETTGEFMGWVSEKQAGGRLTQADIQAAYDHARVQVTDLFPPNDAATVAGRVRQLYDLLAPKAGA